MFDVDVDAFLKGENGERLIFDEKTLKRPVSSWYGCLDFDCTLTRLWCLPRS